MDQIVPDDRSKYEDLTLFSVFVVVNDDVTELYGVVDSESDDNEAEREKALENYLTQTNYNVSSQSMARTKQTASKSDSKGQIPSQSSSGHMLATFPNRWSPRFLDSDSDLERAANMFGVKSLGVDKDLQLEVHQPGDLNAPLHPPVLIPAHHQVNLPD